MPNSLYKLFEHKCVLEVCVHIHSVIIKIHIVFFFNPFSRIRLFSDSSQNDVVLYRPLPGAIHEFTLTFNLIAVVGIFGLLSWGRAPSPEHGPNPENSPVPDEGWNRLGVRSWGGGGMLENCHWTEVGRLYLFIHVRVVLIRMVS